VADVDDVDGLVTLVDPITNPVLAATSPPLAFGRFPERSPYSTWVFGQRPEHEFDTGSGGDLR
jgi:hypothetical protein